MKLNYTIYFFNFYEVEYKLYYIIFFQIQLSNEKKTCFQIQFFINKQLSVQKITFNPLELREENPLSKNRLKNR